MPDSTSTTPLQTKTTFGLPSLLKETPQIAKTIGSVVIYTTLIANAALAAFPQIPPDVKATVAGYSASASLFVKAVASMFGVQLVSQN